MAGTLCREHPCPGERNKASGELMRFRGRYGR